MTAQRDTERAELRALIAFTEDVAPDYGNDPRVQRRVGCLLAYCAARVPVWPSAERPW
jgi:hypothetical protein